MDFYSDAHLITGGLIVLLAVILVILTGVNVWANVILRQQLRRAKRALMLLVLLGSAANAQEVQLSIGADARNALDGSKPTGGEAAADLLFGLKVVTPKSWEYALGYETFHAIGYRSLKASFGKQVEVNGWLEAYGNVEPTEIIRTEESIGLSQPNDAPGREEGYFSVGANAGLNFRLNDWLDFGLNANLLWRRDLDKNYGGTNIKPSGDVRLVFKIPYGQGRKY